MKVYVSPTYHGNGWFDPKAGMNFFKRDGEITIPEGTDLTNIRRYITLNYLCEVEEKPAEVITQTVVSTAKELLSKDVKVEEVVSVVEEKVEEPVSAVETIVSEEPKPEDVEVKKPKKAPKKSSKSNQ